MGSLYDEFPNFRLFAIAEVGPSGGGTRMAFTKSESPGENSEIALWHHKTAVTRSMGAMPDTGITAKPEEMERAAAYWRQRGAFLLPERLRLPVTRAMAVRLPTPALGSAWVPCRPMRWDNKESLEKALCAYANSSVGIGGMLANRSNKNLVYPRFSLMDLRKWRVPNFDALGASAEARLADAYDRLEGRILLPLPLLDNCPVRRELDMEVCFALGLGVERVAKIRRHLAAESSLTGSRYAGWDLLSEGEA